MKKILSLLLALCLTIPAFAAEIGQTNSQSGLTNLPKLSQTEIRELLAANPTALTGDLMAEAPSLTAPHTPGKMSEAAQSSALGRFNAMRRLAGLGPVTLDAELSEKAQHGAVLLAVGGKLDHKPTKPADMDDTFYQVALNATSSSNIYYGTNATPAQMVDAFMDDSDAGNIANLGHRRWLLNPAMGKTGFGFTPSSHALSGQTYNFGCQWAFDRSNPSGDYDFISWPASGNFPSDIFGANQGWSVTLNPEKYAAPVMKDLTVTLTRNQDGHFWEFSGDQTYKPSDSYYMNVDPQNYGIANCIIFRPELDMTGYDGSYTVTVSGLKTKTGAAAELSYTVDFFAIDPQTIISMEVESVSVDKSSLELAAGETYQLKTTVRPAGIDLSRVKLRWRSYNEKVATVSENGLITALSPGATVITVSTADSQWVDTCMVTVPREIGLTNSENGQTNSQIGNTNPGNSQTAPDTHPTKFSDVPPGSWYYDAVTYVAEKGLFWGTGGDAFDPDGPMSRSMLMTVLARLDGHDTDPRPGENWDTQGIRWAVTRRVSDGLNPEDTVSLEQLAQMVYRYYKTKGETTVNPNVIQAMPDGNSVSAWAREGVAWGLENGLLRGDENRRLNPQRSATRSQVAIVLQRFLEEQEK